MKKLLIILTLAAFALTTTVPQVEAASATSDATVQAKTDNSKKSGKKGKKGKKKKKKGKMQASTK